MSYVLAVLLTAFLVGADRITKYIAGRELMPIGTKSVINGFFSLTYVENSGAAFGFLQNGRAALIILSVVIIAVLVFYYIKLPASRMSKYIRLSLIFVLAGALGNLIDRIRLGVVVDFFHFTFIDFPVFNFADVFIVAGTFALAALLVAETRVDAAKRAE